METTCNVKGAPGGSGCSPSRTAPGAVLSVFMRPKEVSLSFQPTDLLPPFRTLSMESPAREATPIYPKTAAILALAGGMIIILGGVIFLGVATYVLPHLQYANLTVPHGLDRASLPGLISGIVGVMGAFGLICGAVVLVSSTMLLARVGQRRTWGILILVFSVLSFMGLGGFVIGAVLGIAGGVMALRWKPPSL